MNRGGEPGLELSSRVVTVSTADGVCPAREAGSVGAERFVATITHTGEVGSVGGGTLWLPLPIQVRWGGVGGGGGFVATITHTGEVGSGGGRFVATITHTGEVGSTGGGGGALWLPLPIQVRWGAWGGGGALWLPLPIQVRWGVWGGGALCGYHYPYR